jgi:hypothetical protein
LTSTDPPLPPEDEPQRLEYRTPDPLTPQGRRVFVGAIIAIGFWGFGGFVGTLKVISPAIIHQANARSVQPSPAASYAVGFLLATVAALVVFAALSRPRRRGFVLGLLIGTACMGLIEGICFLNQ